MQSVVNWLAAHNAAVSAFTSLVTAVATVVLMVTTMVYACLTRVLANETKALRRAGTEPDIVAYLVPHPVHLVVINVVVVNVGKAPARDVEIEFEADQADFAAHHVRYPAGQRRRIMAVLPQDERYVQVFGGGEDLYKGGPLKDFTIRVHFTNSAGKRRTNSAVVSMKDFEKFGGFDPPEYEVAKAIKKIEEHMEAWSSGAKRLNVETITQQEQAELSYKRLAEAKAIRDARLSQSENKT